MAQQKARPRYAHLARKALRFYLGDLYDPKTFSAEDEYNFRFYVSGYVELKVFDKEPYDWPAIDTFFRFYLNVILGYKHIPYDQRILDSGYNGVMRGELPTYHA